MHNDRKLTALKNIGIKLAARLNEVGIFSEQELRFYGAAAVHSKMKHHYPTETLPVCYYLYSFEGALRNCHWNDIPEKIKKQLQDKINI